MSEFYKALSIWLYKFRGGRVFVKDSSTIRLRASEEIVQSFMNAMGDGWTEV